jgi:acetyl-CoA carboxylase biotin carboxyl carrier protein
LAETSATWLEAVQRIVSAVQASDVTELQIEHGTFRVRLRRGGGPRSAVPDGVVATDQPTKGHAIVAPFTGVYFRAPSPTARPYVSEGDWVETDAVVGLIETMKIFNEVTADRPGRVLGFLAQGGQLVHAGDPLVLLEPAERSAAAPEG